MANQVTLEVAAGSSSPPSMNENNESSSASSTCDGDRANGNSSADVLSNDATAILSDPRRPVGPIADNDSNGESCYLNAVGASGDITGIVPDYRIASGDGSSSVGSVYPQRSSMNGELDDKSTAATITTTTTTTTTTITTTTNTNSTTITATTPTTTIRKTDEGVPADASTYRIKCEMDLGPAVVSRSPSSRKVNDCHEIVKSSAVAGERRGNLCSVHQSGVRKAKINVACQTDPDEETFPKITQCSRTAVSQPNANKGTVASSSIDASSPTSSTSSDGTLRLMIQNFTNMADTVRGPSKKIQTVPWRIMVMPRQHVVQKKGTQKCLGFFLQCCPDAYSDSWSCQAAAELRLISQKQGVPHFTRKTNHVYTAKENDWGYSCFMTWADILDESQGYIKDDKVILEVSVKAEPPKNILTHEQFEKKIQDYMRLADIQSSRGLIDKAIEVNMSALKFCKDRDQDCKADLEAQKAKLIEMKLKQSIERIEKGPPLGKGDEENSLNQSALKQAISGTATINKQSNMNKSSKSNSNNKSRETNTERTVNVHNRTAISPLNKTLETRQAAESNVAETRPVLQNDKNACNVQETPNEVLLNAAREMKWLSDNGKQEEGRNDSRQEKLPKQVDVAVFGSEGKEAKIDDKKTTCERLNEKPEAEKKEMVVNTDYLENDVFALGAKMAEDGDMLQVDSQKTETQEPVVPVLDCAYDVSGHGQPWELCQEQKEQHVVECSSDEEMSSSNGVSDSEAEGNNGRTVGGVPCSKKMKRSLQSDGTVVRDDCDSCIQAMLEPASLNTEEASCQTDFSVLMPKADAAIVNAHTVMTNPNPNRPYAQPKKQTAKKTVPNNEWRRKKPNEFKDMDSRKKQDEQLKTQTDNRTEEAVEMQKESIARFTSQFANADPKTFPVFPIYHSQQIIGDDLANPQVQQYMDDSTQPNIWSRQYIEEWLKFNIKYCWKYMKNGENPPAAGDENSLDFAAGNIPHFTDAQVQQVMAALSVIGVNCVNAKRVVDKAAEFINTLEMRSKSPFLKGCLQKLAILAGDEKVIEAIKDGRRDLDCSSLDEHHLTAPLVDDADDFSSLMSDCPDDQHDYMLNREVHRIGIFADQAVSKNPLMEVGQAEKLNEHTEKIAQRIALLESDKETLSRQLTAEKEKNKKQEQKHANTTKQVQAQLQSEKEKHEKTIQQLNQKKNELKKLEKSAKQHERDSERSRELQEKNECLVRELQELRQKHAEELRKLQRELQSSQDTRKNMTEEIKGRDTEISELKNQLNERSIALKRSENVLCSERKTFQSNIAFLTERAKKAEVSLLEHKLETGIAVLERAHKDAGQRVKDLEIESKKARNPIAVEELKVAASEWRAKREEVASLITTAKAEFAAQIEQIKAGKTIAQLPKISVPKPPPAPKLKLGQFALQVSPAIPEKAVTPAVPSVGVIGNRSPATGIIINSSLTAGNVAPGAPMQTMSKAPAPPSSPMKSPTGTTTSIAPIGVRPTSHTGSVIEYASSHTTTVSSCSTTQATSSTSSTSGLSLPSAWSSSWDGPLAMNSISELLNPSRSFGPIGTDYGISTGGSSSQLSHPPPGITNTSSHFSSQSNGWSNGSGGEWLNTLSSGSNSNSIISSQSSHYNHLQHQGSGYQSQQWPSWTGYHTPSSNTSDVTSALVASSRSSSPRRDSLLDTLRNHFPHVAPENLKEYTNEYMMRNNLPSFKALPLRELVNYIAVVSSKTQMWSKSSMPPMMHQPPPSVIPNSVSLNISGVDPYQAPSARVQTQQPNVHPHNLMQQQMRDAMES
ncbi:MATH domain family protein [Acanthocheilonema viteae]